MLWGEGLFWCHKWVSTHFSKKHGERVGVRWKKRNKKTQKNRALCHGWSSSRNPLLINPSSQFTPPCQERHQSPLGAALLGGNTKQSVNDLSAHMQVDRARDHLGYRPTSSISDTNTTLPTCSTHSKCVCHQSSGLKQQTQGLCGEGTTRYSGFGGFLPRCVGWVVSDLPVITEKKEHNAHLQNATSTAIHSSPGKTWWRHAETNMWDPQGHYTHSYQQPADGYWQAHIHRMKQLHILKHLSTTQASFISSH